MSFFRYFFDRKSSIPSLAVLQPESTEDIDRSIATIEAELRQLSPASGSDVSMRKRSLFFQKAAAMISHSENMIIKEGLTMMETLVFRSWQRQEAPGESRCDASLSSEDEKMLPSCFYYIALACCKLGNFEKANGAVDNMLALCPNHPQGLRLKDYIGKELFKDGVLGFGGTALAVAATTWAALAVLKSRKK